MNGKPGTEKRAAEKPFLPRDAGGVSSLRKNKNKGRKKGQVKDFIFERSPDSRGHSRCPTSPRSSVVSNTCFEY